jgi:integrase/recombinase XerC
MVKLYKRDRIWWVDTNFRGNRERRSLHTYSRDIAEALRKQLELDVLSDGRLKALTWREFAREFEQWITPQIRPRTLDSYIYAVEQLTTYLDGRSLLFLRDVTPGVVGEFIAARRQELHPSRKRPMTDGGVKHQLRILHRVFGYAIECSYIQKNPVIARNRNATAGLTRPFLQEEITSMLTAPYLAGKPYLRAIVLLFLHTGLRISDVIELRKNDVAGESLILRTRKRGRVVTLPIHPELRSAINGHLAQQTAEQRASQHLFSTADGSPLIQMDKNLRRLWKRVGISHAHAHRFRDTFAVGLLAKGASLYDVAKLLGISVQVAEDHYAPYVAELQERGRRLVGMLDFSGAAKPEADSAGIEQKPATAWTN